MSRYDTICHEKYERNLEMDEFFDEKLLLFKVYIHHIHDRHMEDSFLNFLH